MFSLKLLVLLSLLSIIQCQRRPQVPQTYYMEVSSSYMDGLVAQIAYDHANSWYSAKQYLLSEPELVDLVVSLPFTMVSYHSTEEGITCYVGCCNGWAEVSTENSWWSNWYSSEESSWDAKEVDAEETEAEMAERDIEEEQLEVSRNSIFGKLGFVVNFSQEEQCWNRYPMSEDFFGYLRISRYSGLCSHNGRNGNLWSYDDYGSLASYCMEVDGTPIYYYEDDGYVYVDYYTTDVTEDMFAIPEYCGCEIDWELYQ